MRKKKTGFFDEIDTFLEGVPELESGKATKLVRDSRDSN